VLVRLPLVALELCVVDDEVRVLVMLLIIALVVVLVVDGLGTTHHEET